MLLNTIKKDYYFVYDIFVKKNIVYCIGPYYPKVHFNRHRPVVIFNDKTYFGRLIDDTEQHTALWKFDMQDSGVKEFDTIKFIYADNNMYFKLKSERREHKYEFSISAIMRDEIDNLKPWLDYYIKTVGVEHFYLYDNQTENQEELKKVIKPYVEKGCVTLIKWDYPFEVYIPEVEPIPLDSLYFCQIVALNHCIHRFRGESTWIMNVDIDEYLVPKMEYFSGFLKKYSTQDIGGIYVQDFVYGPVEESKFHHPIKKFLKRVDTPSEFLRGGKVIVNVKNAIFCELHNLTTGKNMVELSTSVASINHYHFIKEKRASIRFKNCNFDVIDTTCLNLYLSSNYRGKIYIKNFGTWSRLGNQMFQYAFMRYLAVTYNYEIVMPSPSCDFHRTKRPQLFDAFKNLPITISNTIEKDKNTLLLTERKMEFDPILMDEKLFSDNKTVIVDGFFQTEKYFEEISDIIRADFKFDEQINDRATNFITTINEPLKVVVHIRRGDNLSKTSPTVMVSDCFRNRALKYIDSKIDNYHLLIFSDDKEWCKQNIKYKNPFTIVEGFDDFEELCIMTHCDHYIIGSSTYSWWGAWLGQNPDKIVVVPDKWFSHKMSRGRPLSQQGADIIPEKWVVLPMLKKPETGKIIAIPFEIPEEIKHMNLEHLYNPNNGKLNIPFKRVKIDIGLSFGAPFSSFWLGKIKDMCVFGFEPNTKCVEFLKGERESEKEVLLKQNGLHYSIDSSHVNKDFFLIPCAIDVDEGIKEFYDTKNDIGCSSLYKPRDSTWFGSIQRVFSYKLSTFFKYFPWDDIPFIDHIKIDAQGNDLRCIQSIENYFDKIAYITAEVGHEKYQYDCNSKDSGHTKPQMDSYMKSKGFEICPVDFFMKINGEFKLKRGQHCCNSNPTYVNTKFQGAILEKIDNSCLCWT